MNVIKLRARFLVSLAALVVTMVALPATAQTYSATYSPSKVMWVADWLQTGAPAPVTSRPGSRYPTIDLLEVGEEVRVTAKTGNWFKLEPKAGQQERFVYRRHLTETRSTQAPSTRMMYAAKRSNVRVGPGTSYGKVGLLEVGEEVRVTAKTGNWFKLEPKAGQQERFVYAPLLTLVRPELGTDATQSADASGGLTTKTITYDNARYHGQTRDSKPHGRGTLTWKKGSRYEGEFRNGKRHGRGVYTSFLGYRYEGEWRNDKKNGRGTLTDPDGDRYTQVWRGGKARDAHKPSSTCLTVDRENSSMGYWVNRCQIGIDVIWRDEGSCRSRPRNKYPCSSFVKRKATATLEGQVWWHECESPGGLGDVIAIEKDGSVYCVDSASTGTLARKKALRHNSQQAIANARAAIERARRENEAWRRKVEEDWERENAQRNAELQRIRTRTWNNIGQSLQTLQNQERLRRRQAEQAEFQRYLQQLRNPSSTHGAGAGTELVWCTTASGQCGVIVEGRCEYYDVVGGCQ